MHEYLGLWNWATARWIACPDMRSTSSASEKAAREASPRPASSTVTSVKSAEQRGARIDSHRLRMPASRSRARSGHVLSRYRERACCCTASSPPPIVQDRDGGLALLATLPIGLFPFSGNCSADERLSRGRSFTAPWPASCHDLETEIVKRSASGEGLRRPAQALGGRTHHRLAQPLPPTGQGLGDDLNRQRARPSSELASIRLMLRKLCNPT